MCGLSNFLPVISSYEDLCAARILRVDFQKSSSVVAVLSSNG